MSATPNQKTSTGLLQRLRETRAIKATPRLARLAMNLYPPFIGAGIRITSISGDWREVQVAMPLRWYNKNAAGTHFGGSLFAMTDPILMLMLMQILGREYVIWDKASSIEFVKPGRGTVRAVFTINEEEVAVIRERTADGSKYLPEFSVMIVDEQDELVAKVEKVLYIRKKRPD